MISIYTIICKLRNILFTTSTQKPFSSFILNYLELSNGLNAIRFLFTSFNRLTRIMYERAYGLDIHGLGTVITHQKTLINSSLEILKLIFVQPKLSYRIRNSLATFAQSSSLHVKTCGSAGEIWRSNFHQNSLAGNPRKIKWLTYPSHKG